MAKFKVALAYRNLAVHPEDLGPHLHSNKPEGPSTCLTILGIELDIIKLQAQLP